MQETFKALVVTETDDQRFVREIKARTKDELPAGEVLIRVHYSSLNYKDALSASGNRAVTRRYPHTPGVDAAGVVEKSDVPHLLPGDQVLCCCYGLGMNMPGGFGQYIRVPAKWVHPCPPGLSLRESMIFGTGGFTAALSVDALLRHGLKPEQGKILVTGATGGVGSVSVAILSKCGFRVTAATGKPTEAEFLKELGATEVIGRNQATDTTERAIIKGKWAGVIDTVGGEMLATAIKSTRYGGIITCCGNVGGPELHTTVYPFILRGVALQGIDAAECPLPERQRVWQRLGAEWKLAQLERLTSEIGLHDLDREIESMLQGRHSGRTIVNLLD